jgi:ABC-type uncharacterized transport system permease subunit
VSTAVRPLRLLGAAVGYEFRKATAFRVGFIFREAITGLERPIVMIFVYLAMFKTSGATELGGFTLAGIVQYLILATVLMKLVAHEWVLDLAEQIFDGYVTKFFVMPFRFFTLPLGRFVQYTTVQLTVCTMLWLVGAVALPQWWPQPASLLPVGQALVLVLLGSYCYFLLLFIINVLAFWLDVVWSLLVMSRFIMGFTCGQLIPVSMMPEALQRVLIWTFPYWTVSAPAELVMGRLGTADFQRGLLTLLVSAGLLQLLATMTWRRGLRRHSGVGM